MVLYQEDARRGGVVCLCCRRAAQHGIRPGMSLAEAQGLLGGGQRLAMAPVFALYDPQQVHAALRDLAIECQRFSPVVGVEGLDAIVLDLSGCAHLHGGEERLAERFLRFLRHRGYVARIAIADTLGAAWACAQWGAALHSAFRELVHDGTPSPPVGGAGRGAGDGFDIGRLVCPESIAQCPIPSPQYKIDTAPSGTSGPSGTASGGRGWTAGKPRWVDGDRALKTDSPENPGDTASGASHPAPALATQTSITIVPSGRQAEVLAALPVAALRLPESLLETLDELGLRQIGQLLKLPRKSLPARFGPELIRRLDQALGDRPELIEPIPSPQPIEAAWELEYPTGDRGLLTAVLERLLTQIVEELSRTSAGILRLEVGFIDTHQQELPCTIGLLRPSQSVPHLMGLIQMRLERISLQDEIARVQVRVAATAPLKPQEQRLFSTDVDAADDRELTQLVERMSCHLGPERVVRAMLRADPQPECVVRWRPQLDRDPGRDGPLDHGVPSPLLVRPLKLRARPLEVEVVCTAEGGPPLRLREARGSVGIVRCWGPERIETGWWRGRHIRRDYYRIETETGRRYWVYRTLGRDAWFVQGEFE